MTEHERLEQILKMQGPVKLSNPALQDVDPWSLTISPNEQSMVLMESSINAMYFFQRVIQASPTAKEQSNNI